MATLTTRASKGSALTHTEVDDNFINLNTELSTKVDEAGARSSISVTGDLTYDSATGVLGVNVPVTSVAGKTGDVLLTNADVGLGNVANVDTTNAANISSGTLPSGRLSGSYSISITGNAATAGGLAVHSGTNNEANKIVRTDANGYIQAGWINTISGDRGTTAPARIYASNDAYIRYYTPANFGAVMASYQMRANASATNTVDLRAPIFYDSNNTAFYTNPASTSVMNTVTADQFNAKDIGDYITLYGDDGTSHSITSRDNAGTASDDIRINSYGSVFINLDSNNNNTNGADFRIGRHGGVGSIANLGIFDVYGDSLYCYSAYSFRAPIWYDSNNTGYYFDGSATGASIRVAGSITAYYSDERLKDIIGPIDGALEKVNQLEGFYYTPNKTAQRLGYKNKIEVGVSAQAVERILPEIVTAAPISAEYKTIDYARLTPLLIEAVKELNQRVETIEERVCP